jgi:hypothetical protein
LTKLLYKPFGTVLCVLAGLPAGAIFKRIWGAVSEDPKPPKATLKSQSWGEVLPAAAVEGAVYACVKAAVDRGDAEGFERLTGIWPGEK